MPQSTLRDFPFSKKIVTQNCTEFHGDAQSFSNLLKLPTKTETGTEDCQLKTAN